MKRKLLILAALSVVATSGVMTTTTADAQTNGMERRGDRRDNRDEGREEKAACKAGDEKSRPECRQDKRDTKQEGRGDEADKDKKEVTEGN
jgi:Ni/Co efflux regulator RcnB